MSDAAAFQVNSAGIEQDFYFQVPGAPATIEELEAEIDRHEADCDVERELFIDRVIRASTKKEFPSCYELPAKPAFDRGKFEAFVETVTKYLDEH